MSVPSIDIATADPLADLERARAAARAALADDLPVTPQTVAAAEDAIAAYQTAYHAVHDRFIWQEVIPPLIAVAALVAAPLLLWWVSGSKYAMCGGGVLLAWLALPWLLSPWARDNEGITIAEWEAGVPMPTRPTRHAGRTSGHRPGPFQGTENDQNDPAH